MTAITKHTDASAHPIHQVRWDTHGHSGRSGYPNSIRIPIPNLYPRRLMMHISLNFFAVFAFVFFLFLVLRQHVAHGRLPAKCNMSSTRRLEII